MRSPHREYNVMIISSDTAHRNVESVTSILVLTVAVNVVRFRSCGNFSDEYAKLNSELLKSGDVGSYILQDSGDVAIRKLDDATPVRV